MVTGCEPTSVRFTGLLISSTALAEVLDAKFHIVNTCKFLEGLTTDRLSLLNM